MIYIILIAIMMIASVVITVIQSRNRQQRIQNYIRNSFDKPRDDLDEQIDRLDQIKTLFLSEKNSIAEHELVDDITWEDLAMDNIFALINHTDSYIGEQCLYSMLHDLSKTERDLNSLEEKISHFNANEETRFEVRKKLYGLGKSYTDYDMPEFINTISEHKLKNARIYYILSCILVIIGISAFMIRTPLFIVLGIAVYLINLIVHAVKKEKIDNKIRSLFDLGKMLNTAFALSELVPEFSNAISDDLNALSATAKKSAFFEQKNAAENTNDYSLMMSYFLGPFMIDFIIYRKIVSELSDKITECMRIYK